MHLDVRPVITCLYNPRYHHHHHHHHPVSGIFYCLFRSAPSGVCSVCLVTADPLISVIVFFIKHCLEPVPRPRLLSIHLNTHRAVLAVRDCGPLTSSPPAPRTPPKLSNHATRRRPASICLSYLCSACLCLPRDWVVHASRRRHLQAGGRVDGWTGGRASEFQWCQDWQPQQDLPETIRILVR